MYTALKQRKKSEKIQCVQDFYSIFLTFYNHGHFLGLATPLEVFYNLQSFNVSNII